MYIKINRHKFFIAMFALTFAIGLVLPRFQAGFANAADVELKDYFDPHFTLEEAVILYHTKMNETVNKYLDILINTTNPDVSYVTKDDDCKPTNVSSYCLAVVLNAELTKFMKEISLRSDDFKEAGDTASYTIATAVKEAAARSNFINDEINTAEDTVDLVLATYNEIQTIYPVHKELISLLAGLESYNTGLKDIRDIIEGYPGKFNDATTIECK